jgi:hypothetical protein
MENSEQKYCGKILKNHDTTKMNTQHNTEEFEIYNFWGLLGEIFFPTIEVKCSSAEAEHKSMFGSIMEVPSRRLSSTY